MYTFAVDMNTVLQRLWYGCNMSALGERSVRIREVEGSNPFRSTKQVLDEHLFLQRRLRREGFALIHNRKAASWEESRGGAFLLSAHSIYANSPATISGTTGYNNKELIPEIDAGKESTPEYYYHFHTYNRKGGHVYYLFP